MVMMPGSVADERMFSTPKYIHNAQRNRLQAQHLTCCAQGLKSSAFNVEPFLYPEAILEWISAKKRRGINSDIMRTDRVWMCAEECRN
jgi:hypothetical protein